MSFLKKRVTLEAFIRMIANEVLQVPRHTYEDYLAIDSDSILSRSEFEEFVENMSSLRLLLLYNLLIDSKNRGVVRFDREHLQKTFIQALLLSYQDNAFAQDEAQRRLEIFNQELDSYSGYLESVPEEELLKDGFLAYACLYFTSKFTEPAEENVKNGIYVSLINTQRLSMKGYFGQAVQRVKIV